MGRLARQLGWPAVAAAVAALVTALSIALSWTPPFQLAENRLMDLRIALLAERVPISDEIALVAITEETLSRLPYREPQDRGLLARIVDKASESGARAVGLDLLFGQPTEPEKDAALERAIAEAPMPVIIGDPGEGMRDLLTAEQWDFFRSFAPAARRAQPAVGRESVDDVSRYILSHDPRDPELPTLSAALARIAGAEPLPNGAVIDFRLDERGRPRPFPVYPAHAVPLFPPTMLADRLVLVGIDQSLKDRHVTPLEVTLGDAGVLPGVYLHGQVLLQTLDARRIARWSDWQEGAAIAFAAVIGVVLGYAHIGAVVRVPGMLAALGLIWGGGFAAAFWAKTLVPMAVPSFTLVVALGAGAYLSSRRFLRQRRFIRRAMAHYVPEPLVKTLQDNPERLRLGGEQREITALFTDVQGFTKMADATDPQILLPALNDYLDAVSETIIAHGGMIDKFMGDGVMALFNAPLEIEDHAGRAIACARRIAEVTGELAGRESYRALGWGPTRIGVHTGPAMIGNVGGSKRFDYTAIGDTVNAAARLEGANKYLTTLCCISETTVAAAGARDLRAIGAIIVQGRAEPLTVYEPRPAGPCYAEGYALLRAGDVARAKARLTEARDGPDAALAALHLERIAAGETGVVIRLAGK